MTSARGLGDWRALVLDALGAPRSMALRRRYTCAVTGLADRVRQESPELAARCPRERFGPYAYAVIDALAAAASFDGTMWYFASTGDEGGATDEVAARLVQPHDVSWDEISLGYRLPWPVCRAGIRNAITIVDRHLVAGGLVSY